MYVRTATADDEPRTVIAVRAYYNQNARTNDAERDEEIKSNQYLYSTNSHIHTHKTQSICAMRCARLLTHPRSNAHNDHCVYINRSTRLRCNHNIQTHTYAQKTRMKERTESIPMLLLLLVLSATHIYTL